MGVNITLFCSLAIITVRAPVMSHVPLDASVSVTKNMLCKEHVYL